VEVSQRFKPERDIITFFLLLEEGVWTGKTNKQKTG
jgi:hypothetical protein